jgi:hypothetical protein
MIARVIVSSFSAVGVLEPTLASAQPTPRGCESVDQEVDVGLHLREQRLHRPALDVFLGIAQRCPSALVTAQIGLAEAALERWEAASEHLTQALASESDPWVASRRQVLTGALGLVRRRLAELDLRVNVPDAEVLVDGVPRSSRPLWLTPGRHHIEVRAAGYDPWALDVELRAEVARTERAALERTRVTAPGPQPAAVRAPVFWYVGWGLLGLGAVSLGVAGLQSLRMSEQSEESLGAMVSGADNFGAWARYEAAHNADRSRSPSDLCDRAQGDSGMDADTAAVRDLCASNATARALYFGLGITGLVLVGAGVALVVTHPSRSRVSLSGAPMLGGHFGGAAMQVTF